MRLTIDKESFKSFSKIVLTCTKLGEEIFFECRHDYFTIKSVNEARSHFFFTKLERRFFDEYQAPEQIECKFKSKSCIIPFKSAGALEKNLDTLEFYVDKDKDGATFQMNFDTDDITVHEIGFVNTTLQLDIDEDVQLNNYLMAKIKSLASLFNNFPNVSDYCVMTVAEDKICFETYNFKMNEVRTAFTVKSEVFLEYEFNKKIRCTFVLKPMKTFLSSLDKNANCYFYFEDDNCPIHVIIRSNFIEHKFIIASIDVDIDSINENATSMQAPKELQTTDLPKNSVVDSKIIKKVVATEEDMDTDDFSSSYETDDSPTFDCDKLKAESSLHIKNERFRSIYSTETETDDIDSMPHNSNHMTNSKNNSIKSRQSLSQVSYSDKQQAKCSTMKSQINDSQLMFDDEDLSFGSIPSDFNSEESENQTNTKSQTNTSSSIPSRNLITNHSAIQSNLNQETVLFSSISESSSHTIINNQQTANKTHLAPESVCDNNPTIMETTNQLGNYQVTFNQLSQSNNQATLNPMNNETVNPFTNQTTDYTVNSVFKRSSNSHSTQENNEESIRMTSINLSRIEGNSSMNKEFNDNDDWNFDLDLLADENASAERQIKKLQSTYDVLHDKMPPMCPNHRKNDEKASTFDKFMNSNRSLMP